MSSWSHRPSGSWYSIRRSGKWTSSSKYGRSCSRAQLADFLCRPIGVSVVVVAVAIALVQPALVLTLELVVEHDSFESRAALCQALRSAFVGAIDLDVVFELPFAFNAVPEGLAVTLIAVAMVFEQASAVLRQRHRMLARARHSNRLDQSLFAQMSQVA